MEFVMFKNPAFGIKKKKPATQFDKTLEMYDADSYLITIFKVQ